MGFCNKKVCALTTAVIGVLLLIAGIIFATVGFPEIIDAEIRSSLNLWDPESDGRENFEVPPIAPLMKVYMFNTLNPQDVMDGVSTPIMEEIGPFVYEEIREKQDLSEENDPELGEDFIKFAQYKSYVFRPDLSVHDESFKFNAVNTPLVGANAIMNKIPPPFRRMVLNRFNDLITQEYPDQLFNEFSVGEFLFGGMMTNTAKILLAFRDYVNADGTFDILPDDFVLELPYVVGDNGFAAFNTRNDTTYREHYIVNTGRSDMDLYTQIEKWGLTADEMYENIAPEIGWWKTNGGYQGSNACNYLGGTDGQQFHPHMSKDETLEVFQTDVCKVNVFEYTETIESLGVTGYRYEVPTYSTLTNWKPNLGFCIEYDRDVVDWDECSTPIEENPDFLDFSNCDLPERICPDTLVDITRCMEGAPTALTLPYFYMGPKELREDVNFPEPIADLHKPYIDVEPNTGLAINIHKRIQFNTIVQNEKLLDALENVIIPAEEINKLYYPLFWIDEGADLDEENAQKIKDMVLNPIQATVIVQWLMIALGIVMSIIGVAAYYRIRHNQGIYV